MTGPRRLGVFGGAFDPPHLAHVALARAALAQAQLDTLLIFPTGHAWHKTRPLSPATDRIAMASLAFRGLPGVQVDGRETERIGPTYTVDTLEAVQRENPQATLSLFIGQDQAAAFTSWHRWQAILEVATVFVAEREGTINGNGILGTQSSLQPLVLPSMAISATDIRQRATKGLGISHLVPEAVAGYIAQHHLYRTA